MRPPLAGKRAAARRLAENIRRRLEPVERVLPVRRSRFAAGEKKGLVTSAASASASAESPPSPDEAAARIDAARKRLRATIERPDDSAD